jgi:hypothetical protein
MLATSIVKKNKRTKFHRVQKQYYNWIHFNDNNVINKCCCSYYRQCFKLIIWKGIKTIMILPPHKTKCIISNPNNLKILTHSTVYTQLKKVNIICILCDEKLSNNICTYCNDEYLYQL